MNSRPAPSLRGSARHVVFNGEGTGVGEPQAGGRKAARDRPAKVRRHRTRRADAQRADRRRQLRRAPGSPGPSIDVSAPPPPRPQDPDRSAEHLSRPRPPASTGNFGQPDFTPSDFTEKQKGGPVPFKEQLTAFQELIHTMCELAKRRMRRSAPFSC